MTEANGRRARRRRLRSLLEGVVLLVSLVVAVSSAAGCAAAPAKPAAVTAVLVAVDANQPAPDLSVGELVGLYQVAADPDDDSATALVVTPGHPDIESVDLEPRRPNGDVERAGGVDRLVDARLDGLRNAVRRAAATSGGVDLLRGLDRAARTGASTILVLSSGLSTTDPLDLRVAGWDRDADGLARELATGGLLPRLDGRAVVFTGLGRTAGPQPPLGPHEQAQLRRIWLAVCTAAGGACSVDDDVRSTDPPASTTPAPIVDIPVAPTTPGPPGEPGPQISVPAPLLFRPDSCDLVDPTSATQALAPVASRLRAGRVTVAISGRTAPVGPGDGVALSACRAQAAAALLAQLGIPAQTVTAVHGDGSRLDPPSASHDAVGRLDRSKLAALRRVVFTFSPTPEPS